MRRTTQAMLGGLAVALASAGPTQAYSFTFRNNSPYTLTSVWMHTVSVFCHDVSWSGRVGPGQSLTLDTASICLADRFEFNGGQLKLNSLIGLPGGTFTFDGRRLCYSGICF